MKKINSKIKMITNSIMILVLACSLYSCGGGDANAQDMYNKALVASYSIYTPGQTMNMLMVTTFNTVLFDILDKIGGYVNTYYQQHSSTLPTSIDLTSPQWGGPYAGITTGTIMLNGSGNTRDLVGSNVTFNAYKGKGGYTYTGAINLTSGTITYSPPTTFSATNLTVSAAALSVDNSAMGGFSSKYSGYSVKVDNAIAPTATVFNGVITFLSASITSGYTFKDLSFSNPNSAGTLTISGTLTFNGDDYVTAGTVKLTAASWSGGSVNFTLATNPQVTATLSGTKASFTQADADSWEFDNWMSSTLAP